MTLRHGRGDLLRTTAQCIVHQVNCQGVMGSGVAKQIRDKWPEVYESYVKYCNEYLADGLKHTMALLGKVDYVKVPSGQTVFSIFGQYRYGTETGRRYTNYEAVYQGLERLRAYMCAYELKTVAFPYKMSCDRGGGAWPVILEMIRAVFADTDITAEIIEWDPTLIGENKFEHEVQHTEAS